MRITIIRLSSYGDIVLTEPIFEPLKELGFQTEIIIKKKFHSVVKNDPFIDKIYFYEDICGIKGDFYTDYLVDLQCNIRSMMLAKKIKANYGKTVNKCFFRRWLYVNTGIYFRFPNVIDRYKNAIENAIGRKFNISKLRFYPTSDKKLTITKPYITLSMYSAWNTKSYPYIRELIEIILKRTNKNIVLIGKNDIDIKNDRLYNLGDTYEIDEGAAIIKDSELLITVDTVWMHIGIGMNIPTYAVFGATTPKLGFVSKYNMPTKIIEKRMICRPCTKIGGKRCSFIHFNCMKGITPELIFESVMNEDTDKNT